MTDSTADIPTELLEDLKIKSIPAILTVDGETFIDGVNLSRIEFYSRMPSLSQPPTTAAPSPVAFQEAYERLLSDGLESILSIHVSSKLSGMVNSAYQAAQAFGKRVTIFDSQQLSLGLGYQVMEGAYAALEGLHFINVLERVQRVRAKVRLLALINSLEYLRRSGRVSWLQAGVGELLQIKQLLTLKDGLVESFGRARTFSRALNTLKREARTWSPLSHLTVMHSGIREKAELLAGELAELCSTQPMIVNVTTVIGAHVGPGSIGIAGLPAI